MLTADYTNCTVYGLLNTTFEDDDLTKEQKIETMLSELSDYMDETFFSFTTLIGLLRPYTLRVMRENMRELPNPPMQAINEVTNLLVDLDGDGDELNE